MNVELETLQDKALDWLLIAGPRILGAILVFVIGLWLIRILRARLKTLFRRRNVNTSMIPFIESLVNITLYILLLLLVMQVLGIRLTVFAAVIAAFGAAAGLALSGTLQNFASGVIILMLKPFKAGDNIIAQNIEGKVSSIRIFYTIVTTFDNKTVIIPNSKLSNEVITNITRIGHRRLDIELTFGNDRDPEEIKGKLSALLNHMEGVYQDPPVRIGVSAVAADSFRLMINIWIDAHGFEDKRLQINERILAALREHDISGGDE